MIFGVVVQALGNIVTQVAQCKMSSSWFAPSNGSASILSFEFELGKTGSSVGAHLRVRLFINSQDALLAWP